MIVMVTRNPRTQIVCCRLAVKILLLPLLLLLLLIINMASPSSPLGLSSQRSSAGYNIPPKQPPPQLHPLAAADVTTTDSYIEHEDTYCSGGTTLFDNTVDNVSACEAKCTASQCACFDIRRRGRNSAMIRRVRLRDGISSTLECRCKDNHFRLKPSSLHVTAFTVTPAPPPPSPPSPPPAPSPSAWSQLWLDYSRRRMTPQSWKFTQVAGCAASTNNAVLASACAEAVKGFSALQNETEPLPVVANAPTLDGALYLAPIQQQQQLLNNNNNNIEFNTTMATGPRPRAHDAFNITLSPSCGMSSRGDVGITDDYQVYGGDKRRRNYCAITITAPFATGKLYGVFRLLQWMRQGVDVTSMLPFYDVPAIDMRTWDLWDNQDGTVERGYAGPSVFDWSALPTLSPRYSDYARILASVGINVVVLNNVNACSNGNEHVLSTDAITKRAPLSELLASYGIQTMVSACFASPILVGQLKTADPLDPGVVAWWSTKARQYKNITTSFVGMLVKADSEGQPGPSKYNRTELQGANMLGAALAVVNAVCVWRAFVHPPGDNPGVQPRYQYNLFKPWDAQFDAHVSVQIKNGPFDFQVREPVDALFGQMPNTSLFLELEATQEYTGQAKHLVNLAPQWASYLAFDTMARRTTSTTAAAATATSMPLSSLLPSSPHRSGMAAVSNLGSDPSWTGHPLSAVNTYAFGRLAWSPSLDATTVTKEWIRATWSDAPQVLQPLSAMMMASWEVYENYTSPLGLGFVCAGNHYDMDLGHRQRQTNATKTHLGYDRAKTYGRDYRNPTFVDLESCPETQLLTFHNVPYTHQLHTHHNVSLIQYIYSSHRAGAAAAEGFVREWTALLPDLGSHPEYNRTLQRLQTGATDAGKFRDSVIKYFEGLTGILPS